MESNLALAQASRQSETDNVSAPSIAAPSTQEQGIAWLVHLFTATGAIWGLLSIIAINQEQWRLLFLWMAIAVIVDGLDGFLARAAQVHRVLPNFDGALLDNIVDYLNYVFVPAYFLYAAGLLPQQLEVVLPIIVLLASAYQFSQSDAKTEDHFFKGFPSYWNIVVVYLVMLGLSTLVLCSHHRLFQRNGLHSNQVYLSLSHQYPAPRDFGIGPDLGDHDDWHGVPIPQSTAVAGLAVTPLSSLLLCVEFLSHVQNAR